MGTDCLLWPCVALFAGHTAQAKSGIASIYACGQQDGQRAARRSRRAHGRASHATVGDAIVLGLNASTPLFRGAPSVPTGMRAVARAAPFKDVY